jgi:hypothetical protein
MDKVSGEYKISFTDEKGNAVTKSVTELEEGDIEQLGKASKPVELIDLASKQLTVSERIEAAINSLKSRTGYAIASEKGTEKMMMAGVETAETFTKETLKNFTIENIRKEYGKLTEGLSEFVDKDDPKKMKEALKDVKEFFNTVFDDLKGKEWDDTMKKLKTSSNEFVRFFANMSGDLDKITQKFKDVFGDDVENKEDKPKTKPKEKKQEEEKEEKMKNEQLKQIDDLKKQIEEKKKKQGKTGDLVSYPGSGDRVLTGEFGAFSLDKRDMIIAGDPNKLVGNDSTDIGGFFEKYMKNMETTTNKNINTSGDYKITLDLNVNGAEYMSKNELRSYLEDKGVVALLYDKMKELTTNMGRTSDYNPIERDKQIVNQQYNNY